MLQLSRLVDVLDTLAKLVGAALAVLIAGVMLAQVFFRYVLNEFSSVVGRAQRLFHDLGNFHWCRNCRAGLAAHQASLCS